LRDFLSKLERGKRAARRAHFPRKLGHKSQGGFSVFLSVVIYCCEGGRTVRICTVRTTEKRAQKSRQVLAWKSRQLGIFVVEGQSVQQLFGSVFEVLFFLGGPYSSTDLAQKSRQNFWDSFWVL
jgi:hypothetical protein